MFDSWTRTFMCPECYKKFLTYINDRSID